jgi:succinate dehydrogenase (ubiquinone) membrane anchor subunit
MQRVKQVSFLNLERTLFKNSIKNYAVGPASDSTLVSDLKSPSLGSYHWNAERALSLITVPLMTTAMVYGTIPIVDIGLGLAMPLHCHLGFDAMIMDYFHERKTPILYKVLTWGLRMCTVLTLYGCYVINSKDVGITALVSGLWSGKSKGRSVA